ncbi:MAG: SpoIIE family protein phosphatase [Treponema sp.]|nr:SpoIIE family protein phosphatase [Treponema sp.]
MVLKVYPMFFYNIVSITVFAVILLLIPHSKSIVPLFVIAAAEIILHQILADYFVGTETNFHFFIFMVGILPYLFFDYRISVSIPVTTITTIIFVLMENIHFPGLYEISPLSVKFLRYLNVTISIIIIILSILLYTMQVAKSENKLTGQNLMLEDEIRRASVIQQAFLKQDETEFEKWDVGFFNKPMAGVSGDFFDFYRTNKNLDGFGIFDVSGHGISSGLITMLVKNIIHQEFYNNSRLELWEILNKINDRIIEEKGDVENYLTGILVRFNETQAEMVIAGHPAPIIYKKNSDKCDFLSKTTESSGAIGIANFPTFYISQYVDFEVGDRLLFFSDGATDIINEKKESFGRERLLEAFRESVNMNAASQTEYIKAKLSAFRGSAIQNDDVSFICINRCGK